MDGQPRATFIESARRAQIVDATIQTLAEVGFGRASLARIAQAAGISKGVIAYHFAGKEELLAEVAREVLSRAEEYIRPRVGTQSGGPALLRAYIEANLAFMGEYRNHLIALVEITRNARRPDGKPIFDASGLNAGAASLAELLARFQLTGDFRTDFDPAVMARAIRAAIDAIPRRLAADPQLDVGHYGQELANLFDLATRRTGRGPDAPGR